MKLLVIHTGNLGDLVSASPVIYQLLTRYLRLDVFIRKTFQGLFAGEQAITEIVDPQSLTAIQYDWVIDLDSSSTSRKLLRSLDYDFAWGLHTGWLKKLRHAGIYHQQFPKHSTGHIVRDYDPIFHALGGQGQPLPHLPIQPHQELTRQLISFKANRKALIGLHVHASNPLRSLPSNLVISAMQKLHQLGFALALIAGPQDATKELLDALDFEIFYQSVDIAKLKAILINLDYIIACDSGPLHLAAALGCKSIGIYGPALSLYSASGAPHIIAVEKAFDCRPCNQDKPCPHQRRCLNTITAEELVALITSTYHDDR